MVSWFKGNHSASSKQESLECYRGEDLIRHIWYADKKDFLQKQIKERPSFRKTKPTAEFACHKTNQDKCSMLA